MVYQLVYREKGLLLFHRGEVYASFTAAVGAIEDYSLEYPNVDYGFIEVCDSNDRS